MTLTPIAQRLAVELSLHVLRLGSVAAGIEQDESLSHHTCCNRGPRFQRSPSKENQKNNISGSRNFCLLEETFRGFLKSETTS